MNGEAASIAAVTADELTKRILAGSLMTTGIRPIAARPKIPLFIGLVVNTSACLKIVGSSFPSV